MGDEDSAYYLLESRLRDPSADPTDLPLSLFKSITNNFSDKEVIGSGGFGVVYKVRIYAKIIMIIIHFTLVSIISTSWGFIELHEGRKT